MDENNYEHLNVSLATTFEKPSGVRKSVCLVLIQTLDNFLTHPRTRFRINER